MYSFYISFEEYANTGSKYQDMAFATFEMIIDCHAAQSFNLSTRSLRLVNRNGPVKETGD